MAMLPDINKPSLAAGGEIDRAIAFAATFHPKIGSSETTTKKPDVNVKSPNQDSSNGPLSSSEEEDVLDSKAQKHALIEPMKGLSPTPIF